MRLACVLLALVTLAAAKPVGACTSAVVSAAASASGRPLLWKHRDSPSQHNEVALRDDGKYLYVAVVNGGDEAAREVWMGVNAAGLAVINTASDDLAEPEGAKDGEGRLLKVILQSCASVAEVEALLALGDAGGRDVSTDLGVIDAGGRAVYVEVGPKKRVTYDATATAEGYLLRTNFAYTAPLDQGGGYIRMQRVSELFAREWKRGKGIGLPFVLGEASLDLGHPLTGVDPRRAMPKTGIIDARDTINRSSSVSDGVFEGVRPNEPPAATAMWVALGQPLVSLAVPVWPVPQSLPAALNGAPRAKLEELSDRLRLWIYPQQRGNTKHYLDARRALAARARLDRAQASIFRLVDQQLAAAGGRAAPPERLAAITRAASELAEQELTATVQALAPASE